MISLPKTPYIYCIYMVLANPTNLCAFANPEHLTHNSFQTSNTLAHLKRADWNSILK